MTCLIRKEWSLQTAKVILSLVVNLTVFEVEKLWLLTSALL